MNERITIIVPVYNVEKYLDRCVNSILNQTYKEFEVILVDDGSTDSSKSKCDFYAEKYENISVIHKSNGGLSDARNAGLEIVTTDLIAFVDSDDFLHPQYLEILHDTMIQTKSDIVECKFIRTKNEDVFNNTINMSTFTMETMSGVEYLEKKKGFPVAWNKLYKMSLFTDIRYPVGLLHEDEATTYKLVYKASLVTHISIPLYGYYQNDTGIMRSQYNKRRLDIINIQKEKVDFFKMKKEKSIYEYEKKRYCNIILTNYHLCMINNMKKEALELKKLYNKVWFQVLFYRSISLKSKIVLAISRVNHSVYGMIALKNK